MNHHTLPAASNGTPVFFRDHSPEAGHALAASNCMFRSDAGTGDLDQLCLICRGIEAKWLR
ncbi:MULTISPECIES: hypothetical protein [Mycolicibacter]|uniref:Uncharacterized protein n=2 Tax=Mycolicibacter TaxID=1073531 RepID=A0ABU5XL33_9MYCO|nr:MULTISPECIES: hypothetical protein [unclassified Mycolicibacter]MEB3022972.1 hypothetical protein [Mycolicibacter sp. MYC098]MEB3033482.1 hypothetical protein [Mycolicibacter sp. MYC340]